MKQIEKIFDFNQTEKKKPDDNASDFFENIKIL